MPPSPTLAARDHRILARHAAGATVPELALAEVETGDRGPVSLVEAAVDDVQIINGNAG